VFQVFRREAREEADEAAPCDLPDPLRPDTASELKAALAAKSPAAQAFRAPTRRNAADYYGPKASAKRRAVVSGKPDEQRAKRSFERDNGGEGGIRTHGDLAATPVFKTGPFDHSGTSPLPD
jgi:hypothetical protein